MPTLTKTRRSLLAPLPRTRGTPLATHAAAYLRIARKSFTPDGTFPWDTIAHAARLEARSCLRHMLYAADCLAQEGR